MKKYISVIVCLVILVTFFCSCGRTGDKEEKTKYVISDTTMTQTSSTEPVIYDNQQMSEVISSWVNVENEITVSESQPQETTEEARITESANTEVATTTVLTTISATEAETTDEKNSKKMGFSDSPDNKFIKAVVEKYGADADNLAAIYVVPEGDENTVLEFDGSKDENGKRIRTKNTLIGIYSVDKNMDIILASLDEEKTEHSKAATIMAFALTIKYMLPEFQDELDG